jgi:hypothetical protein
MEEVYKNDEFFTKYPEFFNREVEISTGDGWYHILDALFKNMKWHVEWKQKHTPDFPIPKIAQIKEKFGGLRFYYDGGDETITGMVYMAEAWAERTCETCGERGETRTGGWVRTLCDKHEAEHQARQK